jgi:hypothetical protein
MAMHAYIIRQRENGMFYWEYVENSNPLNPRVLETGGDFATKEACAASATRPGRPQATLLDETAR